MNITTVSIIAIIVIAILTTIDIVKWFKAKKMIDRSLENCFKAIKERELK